MLYHYIALSNKLRLTRSSSRANYSRYRKDQTCCRCRNRWCAWTRQASNAPADGWFLGYKFDGGRARRDRHPDRAERLRQIDDRAHGARRAGAQRGPRHARRGPARRIRAAEGRGRLDAALDRRSFHDADQSAVAPSPAAPISSSSTSPCRASIFPARSRSTN